MTFHTQNADPQFANNQREFQSAIVRSTFAQYTICSGGFYRWTNQRGKFEILICLIVEGSKDTPCWLNGLWYWEFSFGPMNLRWMKNVVIWGVFVGNSTWNFHNKCFLSKRLIKVVPIWQLSGRKTLRIFICHGNIYFWKWFQLI